MMSMEEYYEGIAMTSMNYDTLDMTQAYFLKLNDDKRAGSKTGRYCTSDCTAHTLTVTSDIDQMVHIGAHIW